MRDWAHRRDQTHNGRPRDRRRGKRARLLTLQRRQQRQLKRAVA